MSCEEDIQVSVCIITYNQEKYIGQCLDSLISQETNFKFEIIVAEDCSTDGTREIIQSYIEKYPDLIVPLFHSKNVGPVENVKQAYKKAKGKYIAHLDGDDIALFGKLQRQYDVLEANRDCSICVHNMKAIDRNGIATGKTFKTHKETKYKLLDLYLSSPLFIHSSKMFTNQLFEYIDQMNENALDLEFHIEQAKLGDIYVLAEELGAYRQFVGVTYRNNLINEIIPTRVVSVFENVENNRFSKNENVLIKKRYSYILLKYSYYYMRYFEFKKSMLYLVKFIRTKI